MRCGTRGRCVRLSALPGALAWCLCELANPSLQPAAAQAQIELAVMQDTSAGVPEELVRPVDAALSNAVAEVAAIREPFFSPVAYGEVQLTVGCSDESVACMAAIAETAQADAVLVRQLAADDHEAVRLRLLYFRRSDGQPPVHAEVSASRDHQAQLIDAVSDLVRGVLGLVQARMAQTAMRSASDRAVRGRPHGRPTPTPLTWILLGAGTAVLAPGVALALSADADYDDYRRTEIDTREDVARARSDFDSIETRATWANVLIPAGALTLGVGVALLAIDLSGPAPSDQRDQTRLFVVPSESGAVVAVRGTVGEVR
jgi:hypothetical protein